MRGYPVHEVDSRLNGLRPKSPRHIHSGHDCTSNFQNVSIFSFYHSILFRSTWTCGLVNNTKFIKKGWQVTRKIPPPLSNLKTWEFGVKLSTYHNIERFESNTHVTLIFQQLKLRSSTKVTKYLKLDRVVEGLHTSECTIENEIKLLLLLLIG